MKEYRHYSLLLFLFLLISTLSAPPHQYKENLQAELTADLQKLTYSYNHRLLVGFKNEAEGEFFVFDGIRLDNAKKIYLRDENKQTVSPSTFEFSQNDDMLIVGSKEGGVYGFQIVNNEISSNYSYSYSVGSRTEEYWIRDISISTENKIAITAKTSLIILNKQQGTDKFVQQHTTNFTYEIYTLSWSVLQPNILIVGTLSSSEGEFLLYDLIQKTSKLINKDKTQSIVIFPNGKTILRAAMGKNVEVYQYQTGDIPVYLSSLLGTNNTKSIHVSKNGLYFALRTNAGQIKAWSVQNEAEYQNLKNQESQLLFDFISSLNQTGRSLALGSNGGDLLIIPISGGAEVTKFSLCENKTYFNEQTLSCQDCSQNCNTCFEQSICINCQQDKFISGDQCLPCNSQLDGCQTCSTNQNCLTCSQKDNWNYQPKQGKCQCKDTYFNKNGQCSTCEVFLDCLNCAGQNNCTLCKQQNNFSTQPVEGLCQCKPSFWLNQTQCIQCELSIPDCLFCSQDGSKCSQCQSSDRKPNDEMSKCICVDYKYEDQQTKTCQLCDQYQNCITCKPEQPSFCLKCDTQKYFLETPQNGKCVCQPSYFYEQGICKLCSEALLDCQLCNSRDQCLLCKDQNKFDTKPVNGKCQCIEKWILVDEQCKLCQKQINGCVTCSSNTNCTICDEQENFDKTPINGLCQCKAQYWLNGDVCQLCSSLIPGCSTCTENGQKCLTCSDDKRQPSDDGLSCICKPFTYEDPQNKTCYQCDPKHSCIQCQQTGEHKCKLCDSKGHWNSSPIDGNCQCQSGFNQYDGKCVFCLVPGCKSCPTQDTCVECQQQKNFQPFPVDNKVCQCIKGTRLSDDRSQCVDCNATILGCVQCINAKNCEVCNSVGHFIIDPTNDDCHCQKGYYLKNNLTCDNCSSAIENCLYCSLVMNNNVQCNQCQKGYGTASNKKNCISCREISPGCINCDQSNKCTQCDEQNGFVMDGTKCVCSRGFYLSGDQCISCSETIPGCQQCTDQKTCIACNSEEMFIPEPNSDHKCDCIAQWTLHDGKCVECSTITGCLTCSDIDTCTQCDQSSYFQLTDSNKCQCKSKYYLNSTQCQLCSDKIFNCQTCSQDGQKCLSCSDPFRVLNQNEDQCICQEYTFENDQLQCEFCDDKRNCKQCKAKGQCLTCDIDKKWVQKAVDGKCICQTGYQQWSESCLLCQINGCLECHQQNNCFACSQDKKFSAIPVDGQCQCQPNTFLENDKCLECAQKLIGCQQCDNLKECRVCNEKNYFVLNEETKLCQCDSHHYFVDQNCIACSQGIQYCSECIIKEQTKQCKKCQKGYTINVDDKLQCLNCGQLINGCIDCSDIKTCQQCNNMGHFQLNQDGCQCVRGYFLSELQCQSCSQPIPGCIQCDQQGKECSECDQGDKFQLNENTKICECKKGFYLNDHQCDECSTVLKGCEECLGDGSRCLTCSQGFYNSQGECLLCSNNFPGCSKCSADGQRCFQCNTEHFVFNETSQVCDCIQSYFLKDRECQLCSKELLACSKCSGDGKECLECSGANFVLNEETKHCECESSYFLKKNQTCQLCSQVITGCSQCNQAGSQCVKCNSSEKFIEKDSVCACIDGYFLNGQQKTCEVCSSALQGCSKCDSIGKQCTECGKNNFVLNNQTKQCQCRQGYYTASNLECKLCSESISYCEICSSGTQNQLTPSCLQCRDTFKPNQAKTQCICEGDDKEIIDGLCKSKEQPVNWLMYGIIGGAALVLIGICVLIYLKIKRAKLVKLDRYNELDQQGNSYSAKPSTIITSNSAEKIQFKSSVYQLEDQEN